MAIDEEANRELNRICNAKNEPALLQMYLQGRAWDVQRGTKAILIEGGIMTVEVRILDGPHAGKQGILPVEFIHQ